MVVDLIITHLYPGERSSTEVLARASKYISDLLTNFYDMEQRKLTTQEVAWEGADFYNGDRTQSVAVRDERNVELLIPSVIPVELHPLMWKAFYANRLDNVVAEGPQLGSTVHALDEFNNYQITNRIINQTLLERIISGQPEPPRKNHCKIISFDSRGFDSDFFERWVVYRNTKIEEIEGELCITDRRT